MSKHRGDEILSKELILQIEKITSRMRVHRENLELVRRPDELMEDLVIECVRRVCYTSARPIVSYPTTWWDAFKVRWFPQWARLRWPATFTYLEARVYFPDLPVPRHGDKLAYYFFDWKETKPNE